MKNMRAFYSKCHFNKLAVKFAQVVDTKLRVALYEYNRIEKKYYLVSPRRSPAIFNNPVV